MFVAAEPKAWKVPFCFLLLGREVKEGDREGQKWGVCTNIPSKVSGFLRENNQADLFCLWNQVTLINEVALSNLPTPAPASAQRTVFGFCFFHAICHWAHVHLNKQTIKTCAPLGNLSIPLCVFNAPSFLGLFSPWKGPPKGLYDHVNYFVEMPLLQALVPWKIKWYTIV